MLQHSQQQNGCCCKCHDALNATTFSKSRGGSTGFNPEYPEPVHQTALNESRGRYGVPDGNKYTIANGTTRSARQGMTGGSGSRTKEEEAADAMAELDRLERLLMLEHKTRVRAAMEADKLSSIGSLGSHRLKPLPEDYKASLRQRGLEGSGGNEDGGTFRGDQSYGTNACTIHEAYDLAHDCPVPPPMQCHASHRLQDTLDDLRLVTMDPALPSNRSALKKVLFDNGIGNGAPQSDNTADGSGPAAADTLGGTGRFGNSLAQIRNSNSHPQGAGVVWGPKLKGINAATLDVNTLTLERTSPAATAAAPAAPPAPSAAATPPPPAATVGGSLSKAPPHLSPGAAAAVSMQKSSGKKVTYVL